MTTALEPFTDVSLAYRQNGRSGLWSGCPPGLVQRFHPRVPCPLAHSRLDHALAGH